MVSKWRLVAMTDMLLCAGGAIAKKLKKNITEKKKRSFRYGSAIKEKRIKKI